MSNEVKKQHSCKRLFCGHLKLTDDTIVNVPVKILKKIGTKYQCEITVSANPKNHSLMICKNSKIVLEVEAPKKCPHPDCECPMSLTINL
jgi:hypothetical protein